MRLTRIGVAAAIAASALLGTISAAEAAPKGPNASKICRETNNFDGFLGSHGGCVSTVSSIGIDAVINGAFPSQAAAIANCKGIEQQVGGFPYYFYDRVGDSRYLATNYRSCVNVLYGLHTGALQPGPAS